MNEQEQIKALTALAFAGGDFDAAQIALGEEGIDTTAGDLLLLQQANPEQYGRLREHVQRGYEAEVVPQMLDRVREATEVERLAIQRTKEALEDEEDVMSGRDAAAAAYSISRVKVGNVDKMTSLAGRMNGEVDDVSVEAALRELERSGFMQPRGHMAVTPDADAEDEPPVLR